MKAHYATDISCVMPASFTSASVCFTIPKPLQSFKNMKCKLRSKFSGTAYNEGRLRCDNMLVACSMRTEAHTSCWRTGETRTSLIYLSTERTDQLGLQWSNNAGAVRSMVVELTRP